MATKIRRGHFSGSSKVFSREPDSLEALLRGVAIDNTNNHVRLLVAETELDLADLELTDSSTGDAANPPVMVAPTLGYEPVTAATAIGAPVAALNTALGVGQNALAVIVGTVAVLGAPVGITTPAVDGTVATPGTIPAQTKTLTAASEANAASLESAAGVLRARVGQFRALTLYANEVLGAVGLDPIDLNFQKFASANMEALDAITATPASGEGALSNVDAIAFLVASADLIATFAAAWNARVDGYDPAARFVVAG